MATSVCTICGQQFTAVDRRAKFCPTHRTGVRRDRTCLEIGSNNRNWRGGRTLPIERTCRLCPKSFITCLTHDKQFCSPRCAAIWGNIHSKKRKTNPELLVGDWLTERDTLSVQTQVLIPRVGIVDFLVGTTVIECDGVYWHTKLGRPEKDAARDKKLNELGYTVIRISDQEMKQKPLTQLFKLKAWIATGYNKQRVTWQGPSNGPMDCIWNDVEVRSGNSH